MLSTPPAIISPPRPTDRACGRADRIHAGAAQAVDRRTRHVDRQAGQQAAMRATSRLSSPAWLAQP
jgi:hypothetical protein